MILVTGSAGFIGYYLSKRLLEHGYEVLGIDNLNNYYDIDLKKSRLAKLTSYPKFEFKKIDISNIDELHKISINKIDFIIHLAAQAGVRFSFDNPGTYFESNLKGFYNILELTKITKKKKLFYASSSSVYGNNEKTPFDENDIVDKPISFYAATKKCNEIMAESYEKVFNLNLIGLRFFTVYGPFGRPDMAYFKFVDKIYKGETISIYNNGHLERDFTYIEDIIESIFKLFLKKDREETFKHQIFNIGNGAPVNLLAFIKIIEKEVGIVSKKEFLPMQPGDVYKTWANTDKIQKEIDFKPQVSIDVGIKNFVEWYKKYYKTENK